MSGISFGGQIRLRCGEDRVYEQRGAQAFRHGITRRGVKHLASRKGPSVREVMSLVGTLSLTLAVSGT